MRLGRPLLPVKERLTSWARWWSMSLARMRFTVRGVTPRKSANSDEVKRCFPRFRQAW